ncbi:DAK2 domain-containing protein [Cohnella zeiphila]|uniref:DAK2 domain-containing protein n=1 Tax=Cohnella zeiphila TaxID=2761120 RepID=A0A7X0STJ6_9BACL|nr:DAK2 domain-containing protein [Cohnella zeiphila]MBB6735845.1 DAK2 domain-containing protein [Cohnella zeiphila]
MIKRSLNGTEWTAMVLAGAASLAQRADRVNELNVFPVPDGDTGTNMDMTMKAGAAELAAKPSDDVGRAAETLAKGLLMGARGNSGVILSQLFRGFSRAVSGQRELTVPLYATALQQGVDTAYKSVAKPVEGTILTVAREAARHGMSLSRRTADIAEWMDEVYRKAVETLNRTPDMLPVLKQVGVVDSGGQGLVYLYEGFVRYLTENGGDHGAGLSGASFAAEPVRAVPPRSPAGIGASAETAAAGRTAQARLATESIAFPYDMEFFIRRPRVGRSPFPEAAFRRTLEKDGDSVILIDDGDIVKVHVHSRRPGDVLNAALLHGELTELRILNMKDQHRELLSSRDHGRPALNGARQPRLDEPETLGWEAASGLPAAGGGLADPAGSDWAEEAPNPAADELAPYGIVAVSVGAGNEELLRSLGVDTVISGGTSMNPSTEDLVQAVSSLAAGHVFLLPNHPNVWMAAKQAAELAGRPVTVLPSTSVPQGMAAMLAFREEDTAEANEDRMIKAIGNVLAGQLTKAVRDTSMDGVDIRCGQYIGILNKTIVTAEDGVVEAARSLLGRMLASGDEAVMILTGEDADPACTDALLGWLGERYPQAEIEVHEGGQPLYPYWFMVETV